MGKKTKTFKVILLFIVIAIMTAVTIYLIPVIKELGTKEGQAVFQERINSSGFLGMLMLFGLQFAQIFLFIIPGEPIEILAGICYGNIWGTVFIFILFFIPGTPKDLLTYIAALLPIKPLEFIIISTIARFPSVISSTWAGASLLEGNWQFSLMIYGITFSIVAIIILIMRKFDKNKITQEAIRAIK